MSSWPPPPPPPAAAAPASSQIRSENNGRSFPGSNHLMNGSGNIHSNHGKQNDVGAQTQFQPNPPNLPNPSNVSSSQPRQFPAPFRPPPPPMPQTSNFNTSQSTISRPPYPPTPPTPYTARMTTPNSTSFSNNTVPTYSYNGATQRPTPSMHGPPPTPPATMQPQFQQQPPPPPIQNGYTPNVTFQQNSFHPPPPGQPVAPPTSSMPFMSRPSPYPPPVPPPMMQRPPQNHLNQNPYPPNPNIPNTNYPTKPQQHPHPQKVPTPAPKINPAQIPRPPSHNHPKNRPAQIYRTKYGLDSSSSTSAPLPPSASSRFITIDDGNASPRIMRSTTFNFPSSRSILEKSGLPLALMITPLSPPDSSETIPPIMNGKTPSNNDSVSMKDPSGDSRQLPIKCSRCNAYLNPFVNWGKMNSSTRSFGFGGNSQPTSSSVYNTYECNFCGKLNVVHEAPPMWATKKGTVEYLVDGPYITTPDKRLVRNIHIYALDLTNVMFSSSDNNALGTNGNMTQHDTIPLWKEYLRCMTDVAESLNDAYELELKERKWSLDGEVEDKYRPHIGFFLIMPDQTITIPYLKQKGEHNDDNTGDPEWEFSLAVMSDIKDDPFSPLPISAWTYNVTLDNKMKAFHFLISSVQSVLEKQLKLHDPLYERSCSGSALAVMANALHETGGRATLITSTRPSLGVGSILNRENLSFLYTRPLEEHNVCTPIQSLKEKNESYGKHERGGSFYRKLAEECQKGKVSIDIILLSEEKHEESYIDSATLSELCKATCGKLLMIPHYRMCSPIVDILREELIRSVTKNVGYDAILKVRCSSGFTLKSFLNPPGKIFDDGLSSPELELPCVSSDTGICALLEHQTGGIKKRGNQKVFANIQCVLLYTTPFGQRKLRVSTLALPSTELVSDVFRGADFGCISAVFTREIVLNSKMNGIRSARNYLVDNCINTLSQYRLNTSAKNSPPGQLILPEALQLLPLFVMCLRKSVLLRSAIPVGSTIKASKAPQPSVDERMHAMFHASNISPSLAILLVHPNVYKLTGLKGREGFEYIPQSHEKDAFVAEACKPYIQLPQTCHPSISSFDDESIYLIDDGFSFFLYIGKSVSEESMLEVFGDSGRPVDGIISTSKYGKRILSIMKEIRGCCTSRPTFPPLIVYRSGEGNGDREKQNTHSKIMTLLVDDLTSQDKGYIDFLCALHRKIRNRIGDS